MAIDHDADDTGTSPYNDKLLLAAIVSLSVVIFLVILLHLYSRYLLLLRRRRHRLPSHLALRRVLHSTQPPPRYLNNYDGDRYVIPGHATETRTTVGGGVDPKVAASMPEFVYRAEEHSGGGVECVVCLSVMEEGERGRRLPRCDHAFHVWCIDVWFMAHDTCPICRAPVRMEEEAPPPEEVVVEEAAIASVDSAVVAEAGEMATVEVEKDEESPSSSASNNLSFGSSLLRILSRGRS
ncbi:RING-H2 finger protein ATL5-like [Zingiber officinale]|uniref:RING-type E3 ubiquitin transferase n=1 Tax=Zingiber officinale TaxID=94328 RepID=A0A8J5FQV6_ZINOF|nr:RING-H2 finger protein ATL5-like [Zingiber officinale]KAG6494173.1 hypothetical protein ZIOFF_049192 [Zingiber officinale]